MTVREQLEQDKEVFKNVMGRTYSDPHDVPRYGDDPAADYAVLKHVREHWVERKLLRMRRWLSALWKGRADDAMDTNDPMNLTPLYYEPGDYSRAALAVLTSKDFTHA